MVLKVIFGRTPAQNVAQALYEGAVAQARRPDFYLHCGLPDSLDGRFEMICLHSYLVLRRLGALGPEGEALGQAFVDHLAQDLDRSLREMGVGDLGVGKRVRRMAEALRGRIAAYEEGLSGTAGELEAALRRNAYGTTEPQSAQIALLADYLRREAGAPPAPEILNGSVAFGPPPQLP